MSRLKSLPVVFATTKNISQDGEGTEGEVLHKGSLKMGEEIDIVVTNTSNEPRLKRYLHEKKFPLSLKICTDTQVIRVLKLKH